MQWSPLKILRYVYYVELLDLSLSLSLVSLSFVSLSPSSLPPSHPLLLPLSRLMLNTSS